MDGNSYLSFKVAYGQVVQIGPDVFVSMKEAGPNSVQIRIHAPRDFKIHRDRTKISEDPWKHLDSQLKEKDKNAILNHSRNLRNDRGMLNHAYRSGSDVFTDSLESQLRDARRNARKDKRGDSTPDDGESGR